MIIKKNERLKNAAIASGWPTVLHIAAGAGVDEKHVHFVQRLMEEFLDEGDLLLQDRNGNTAFFFAAAFGNKQVVDLMLKMNPSVANDRGVKGATAVHFAALQARCEMAWHLYDITKPTFTEDDWNQLFFNCINTGLYGLALEMAEAKPELAYARDYYHNETALHLLAKNHSDSCCQSPHHQSHTIMINPGMKQEVVYQLVKSLWRTICNNFTEDGIINIISEPCQPIFAAAEVGNFGFLSELISGYPSLIWARDEKEQQTIIHKAVKYRQASIYNVIHEIGYQKDIIVTIVDTSGNTLLHLAAQIAPPSSLELVSGAAFQMCLELVWFKEVQKIMPPSFIKSTNAEGLTAGELFTREHTQLRKDAESWMKSTAENCMLIATVIATGVFAAAISIPGGVDDAKGKPNYLKKPSFLVFAISDAAAFISSAAAILIFLSILVSRYAESDFYKSLPLKLIFGLLALFCSITSMMVAVASAFFITYYYDSDWVPGFISAFVCLPILLFIILQFKLWYVIMYSTFYCKNLFKPDKKMLYVSKN
ncbi:Ankyrin repeat-containing protein [Arachis hypogaea]|nr:Ankyrin repeat-containing protein [Arachis hypogaea]